MLRRFALVLTLGLLAPVAAQAQVKSSDWPSWRGPNRDAASSETGLLAQWPEKGPKLLWSAKEASSGKSVGTGYSSLTVADGKIYTMGDHKADGFFFCIDAATGKELWATRTNPGQGDGPRCTPTIDGDRVYGVSRQGILSCLDRLNGQIVWQKDFKKDFNGKMMSGWDYSESPLIDGDLLICTPGGEDAAMIALNKKTGETVWTCPIKGTGGAGYASIVISNGGGVKQYLTLLGRDRGLISVDAKTGKFLWNYKKMANGTANIPTPIVKGDYVFTTTGYGAGAALLKIEKTENGGVDAKEVYFHQGKTLQNHHGGVILVGDYLYGGHGHNDGQPFCLHLESGKFTWEPRRGPGQGSAAIAYADGHFYFRYQDNTMALIEANPREYVEKSVFQLPGNLGTGWQHPVIVGGKLYIRGRDQVLCFDVKK